MGTLTFEGMSGISEPVSLTKVDTARKRQSEKEETECAKLLLGLKEREEKSVCACVSQKM